MDDGSSVSNRDLETFACARVWYFFGGSVTWFVSHRGSVHGIIDSIATRITGTLMMLVSASWELLGTAPIIDMILKVGLAFCLSVFWDSKFFIN